MFTPLEIIGLIAIALGSFALGIWSMLPSRWADKALIHTLRKNLKTVRRESFDRAQDLLDVQAQLNETDHALGLLLASVEESQDAQLRHLAAIGAKGPTSQASRRQAGEKAHNARIREIAEKLAAGPRTPLRPREEIVAEAREAANARRMGRASLPVLETSFINSAMNRGCVVPPATVAVAH